MSNQIAENIHFVTIKEFNYVEDSDYKRCMEVANRRCQRALNRVLVAQEVNRKSKELQK